MTGIPVVKKETADRQGKRECQSSRAREVKLGASHATAWDKEGYPIRDPDSTTYTGAIETAQEFGKRIYVEAWKRGWSRAAKKVVMGDGAEWIWNLAEEQFPARCGLSICNARQHLWELARRLHPNDEASQKAWIRIRRRRLLDKGKIAKLVSALRSIPSTNPEVVEKIRAEADYFERNANRMRYPKFRQRHLLVGSGVIEARWRPVIGKRLKRSGMFWTVGALTLSSLCDVDLNGRFEDYGRPVGRRDLHFYVAHPFPPVTDCKPAVLGGGVIVH